MGYALPPGTIVSTQAWSMHRDASVFPSPDTFLPDRWLNAEGLEAEELGRMSQHMMPFGTGSRVCGGQNLAQIMLKVAVAAVARNFDVVAPSETNERTMEMKDSFVSGDYRSFYASIFACLRFPYLNLFMRRSSLLTVGPVRCRSSSPLLWSVSSSSTPANNKLRYLFSSPPPLLSFVRSPVFGDIYSAPSWTGLGSIPLPFLLSCYPPFRSLYSLNCLCFCCETHYHPRTTTTPHYATVAFPLLLCYPCSSSFPVRHSASLIPYRLLPPFTFDIPMFLAVLLSVFSLPHISDMDSDSDPHSETHAKDDPHALPLQFHFHSMPLHYIMNARV